jgi:hypothetical protein
MSSSTKPASGRANLARAATSSTSACRPRSAAGRLRVRVRTDAGCWQSSHSASPTTCPRRQRHRTHRRGAAGEVMPPAVTPALAEPRGPRPSAAPGPSDQAVTMPRSGRPTPAQRRPLLPLTGPLLPLTEARRPPTRPSRPPTRRCSSRRATRCRTCPAGPRAASVEAERRPVAFTGETVSRHFLRRRARARALRLERTNPGRRYDVEPAVRGPYRWRVVRRPL